ncbi:hypothetical protein D9M71_748190 [compost metagenome]
MVEQYPMSADQQRVRANDIMGRHWNERCTCDRVASSDTGQAIGNARHRNKSGRCTEFSIELWLIGGSGAHQHLAARA